MIEIKIKDFISKYSVSRESADVLFAYIKGLNEENIKIDFYGIDGISHSFASQYRLNLRTLEKNIIEINRNENVIKMFKTLDHKKTIENREIEMGHFKL